jgi:hypothetical protein
MGFQPAYEDPVAQPVLLAHPRRRPLLRRRGDQVGLQALGEPGAVGVGRGEQDGDPLAAERVLGACRDTAASRGLGLVAGAEALAEEGPGQRLL